MLSAFAQDCQSVLIFWFTYRICRAICLGHSNLVLFVCFIDKIVSVCSCFPVSFISQEQEGHQASGDEQRRRNGQPEERRSRWETNREASDRPRDRDRDRDRRRERNALTSQEAERQQHDERRRENRQQREENEEQNFRSTDDPPVEKEKPNFGLSGALTEDTNTFRGVVIKYNEPPEARIPKRRWRLYPFKNDEALPVMYIHRQSAYLLGRQRKIADIPIDHPSCSKQHAVFQYR